MKQLLFACLLVLWTVGAASPETAYVTDTLKITMRTGKGTDHKIIQMISSGQDVEVVEPGEDWTKIRLEDGREGFVLTRLLTRQLPVQRQVEGLRNELEALKRKTREPLQEINRLESENKMLQKALDDLRTAYEETQASEARLGEKASRFDTYKARYDRMVEDLKRAKSLSRKLEAEVESLQRDRMIRWFLAGAMVLLIGFLLGIFSRSRRRRSFLQ